MLVGRLRGTQLVRSPLPASSFSKLNSGRGTFLNVSPASSVSLAILIVIQQLVEETNEADSLIKHMVWCAPLSDMTPSHSSFIVLSKSLSYSVKSVCSTPSSPISLDSCHRMCPTRGVIRPHLRLGD
ncbi:unnamed protein product [Protopolystoma xenopodis]|uniref:Uncharacterized protein n=1 Tax=Protopolystoma xenopodis TaxID=117903 RepID=A0A448XHJ8_9PLAT|nr:unnamed protein product [Protopolystoma xenopodis]